MCRYCYALNLEFFLYLFLETLHLICLMPFVKMDWPFILLVIIIWTGKGRAD